MNTLDQINTRRLLNHIRDQITKCLMHVIHNIEHENNLHVLTDIMDKELDNFKPFMGHSYPESSNVVQIYPNKYSKPDKGYFITYLLSNGCVETKLVKNRGLRIVKKKERELYSLIFFDFSITPTIASEYITVDVVIEK